MWNMEDSFLSMLTCKPWGWDSCHSSHVTVGENKRESLNRSPDVVEQTPALPPLISSLHHLKIKSSSVPGPSLISFYSANGNIFTVFSFSAEPKDDTGSLMLFPPDWNFLLENCAELKGRISPTRVFDATRAGLGCLCIWESLLILRASQRVWMHGTEGGGRKTRRERAVEKK